MRQTAIVAVCIKLPLLRYAYALNCETVHMCSLMYSPLDGKVVDNNFRLQQQTLLQFIPQISSG